jgi:glutathione S-transferase
MRVIWLLEELGVSYELVDKPFASLGGADHRKVHPLGQVPAIEDDGLVLYESGAILQHLLERHGEHGLLPPLGSPERGRAWQWFHFGEATLARHISEVVRNRRNKPEAARIEAVVVESRGRFRECLSVLERELSDARPYMVGESFGVADIMLGYPLILARMLKELPDDDYTNVVAYTRRLRERPACKKATA